MYACIYKSVDRETKRKEIVDERTDKIVKDFISSVAQQHAGLVTAYLFGSYAKEKQRDNSDIDIAIIIDSLNDEDKFDVQVQLMLLAAQFDTRIEPHPLSHQDFNAGSSFVSEIKRTGIEVKLRTPKKFSSH